MKIKICYYRMLTLISKFFMAILDLVIFPDERLKKKSEKIEIFNNELKIISENMIESMYKYKGIGLAGVQVGIMKRIFTMNLTKTEDVESENFKDKIYVFINPEIINFSKNINEYEEGCLSFPTQHAYIFRPKKIKIKYQDVNGNFNEAEADGLAATCIQHELDHLNGITMPDRVNSIIEREMMLKKAKKVKNNIEK